MKIYRVEQADGNFVETVVPDPIAKDGEVLVRVRASGVNLLDTKIRAGHAAHAEQPLPAVLSVDMAGVVEEAGEGVTAFKRGDEVYGMTGGVGGLCYRSSLGRAALITEKFWLQLQSWPMKESSGPFCQENTLKPLLSVRHTRWWL